MKRLYIPFLCIWLTTGALEGFATNPAGRSHSIVYINGAKYYVHTVKAGETLYSLSKIYGVDLESITKHNPSAIDGLKLDQTLKIPVPQQEQVVDKKKKKRDFEYHTVAAGETLYSISKRYAVSIETILEDNSEVDPAHISVGTQLYIRRSEMGHSTTKQVQSEWENYKDNLNSVTNDGHSYYIVQGGDTLYSLCKRFGTDEQTLRSLNDLSEGLKAGALIKVPTGNRQNAPATSQEISHPKHRNDERVVPTSQPEVTTEATVPNATDSPNLPEAVNPVVDSLSRVVTSSQFAKLGNSDTLKVALMLPMTRNGVANNNFADFYRGFLLGMEQMKAGGRQVELTLYDTSVTPEGATAIVENEFGVNQPNMIVGPVYENQLEAVVKYAEERSIPVISPLSVLNSQSSPVLFQMAPSPKHKYDKVTKFFAEDKNVTLIYSENIDTEFEQEILEQLKGRTYTTHKYEYEHPSIIENREKERQKFRDRGIEVPDEPISPSDMTPLLQQEGNNTLIVLANNETDVDRILTAIASANISLRAKTRTVAPFTVVGNPKWNRYNNIDRSILFQDNVVMLSSYHARRDNEQVYEFDRRFITEFGALPTLFAYRGFDTAVIFGNGAFSEDITVAMSGKQYTPLMTPYTFQSGTNSEWVRINYIRNYTIKTE